MQLEHRSETAVRTAVQSRAVEVARLVPGQTGVGIFGVGRSGEAKQDSFLAARIQLEHGSETAFGAAVLSGAIEIACGVHGQRSVGLFAVRGARERVEHGKGLCLRRSRCGQRRKKSQSKC